MGFEYRTFEKDKQRLDQIGDSESGFQIIVDRLGAELVGIARRRANADSIAYLYRDGEVARSGKGWQNHATVMGYFLHRLWGEKTLYEGEQIVGGNHGFLRHKVFPDPEVSITDGATLTYSLPAGQIAPSEQNAVILGDYEDRRQVEIDLGEAPFFTIWSDLNPFICIEPCWGLPDHRNQRPFEKKLGIQVIEPGGTLETRFSMRFN